MRNEKLYNLHKTAFFIVASFAFKMDNILSDRISTLQKDNMNEKFIFSYFIFLSTIQIVELFRLHLSPYFIFIHENILGGKKDKIRKKTNSSCTKEKSLLYCQSIFESKMSNY